MKDGDRQKYREKLEEMDKLTAVNAVSINDQITSNVSRIAKECIGRTKGGRYKKKSKSWWNDEIKIARNERKVRNRECRKLRCRVNKGEMKEEEYNNAWKAYVKQKNVVKNLIRNARVKDESERVAAAG